MKRNHALGTILALLALGPAGLAHAVASGAVSEATDLPELQVEGKRLYQMRKDIIDTEDKFISLFNELNKDDDFDVHCAIGAPIGTRIMRRICRPQFYERAQVEWAVAYFSGAYAPPPDLVAIQRGQEYKRKALAVINAHPELRRLIVERDALEKKYYSVRKQAFRGQWFAF